MFRILSTKINPSRITSIPNRCARIYRVYKNPKAEDLFIKAQKAETKEERELLLDKMGTYDIVIERNNKHSQNRFMQFFKGLFSTIE